MRGKIFILLVCAVFVFFSKVEAGQWNLKIQPIWMSVYGNDVHSGDIFKYKQIWTVDKQGGWHIDYSIEYEPINLIMKNNLALRLELNYHQNNWGFYLSGWGFQTRAQEKGMVITPPLEAIPNGYIGYIYGVRMWDHSIIPVINESMASGFSPVEYWATNKMSIFSFDLLGSKTLFQKEENNLIELTWGLKFGKLNNERFEKQAQHALVAYTAPFWVILDNHITLESVSKINYQILRGPSIGLQAQRQIRDLNFNGFLKQSFLFGNVKLSGIWKDIDDINWYDYHTGKLICHDYYYGHFHFAKMERCALPVTEFGFNLSVKLNTKITLSAGGFGSIWWQAPLAPKWSVPGDWTCVEGTAWQCQKATLVFYGGLLNLSFKF